MSNPLTRIGGIDAEEIRSLKAQGIRTTERLLEQAKSPRGRTLLAAKTDISEKRLLMFANAADYLRIKGMGPGYAVLLREAGVDTVRELRYRKPENLASAMAKTNEKRKLVRLLPSLKLVTRWVEHAKKLPLKITYKK
jgi:hypothetical protein